jgi:hypothetical protein
MVLTSVFFGLPLIHWILSPLIAAILIIASIIYALIGWRVKKYVGRAITDLTERVDQLSGYGIENLNPLLSLTEDSKLPSIQRSFKRLHADAIALHQGQWLPDPAPVLVPTRLLTQAEYNSLSLRPALAIFLIGIVASLSSLITQVRLLLPDGPATALFTILPLAIGAVGGLTLAFLSTQRQISLKSKTEELCSAVCRHVPTFGTQTGLSALVNAFLVYDHRMQTALDTFNQTTTRIAESDMAAGVQKSVERVLMETVAPSISQAANALSDLSTELVNRQEKGMHDLAVRFATALSSELAAHLEPISQQLQQLSPLMADVKNYVAVALQTLQLARTESDALAGQTTATMVELATARTGFAGDLTLLQREISRLADATAGMAAIYSGNEKSLSSTVSEMNSQMAQYAQKLAGLVAESSRALREAQDASQKQSETSGQYITDIRGQISRLTDGLRQETGLLLDQMRQETGQLTLQSTSINQRFAELNVLLDKSGHLFADESIRYVRETLKAFDVGLAEIVSRLASSGNEIRDAIDALPQVLRRSADFK